MKLLKRIYEKMTGTRAPYYYDYSILTIIKKPIRKFFAQVVAPNCPFNNLRIVIYRLCGFKIGKHCFIGMKCYLDDTCYDLLTIGDNCTVSYGVYFACHGKKQSHIPITVQSGLYIGMRAAILSRKDDKNGLVIGKDAVIGCCALVNKSIPAGKTAVGVPCRIVDTR